MVALTAGAVSPLDLTIDDLGSGWGATYDSATHTITYEGAWNGKGWWLNDVDYSAYTDVEIEVAPLTIQAKIVCEYVEGESTENGMFDLGATKLTCPLAEGSRAHTKQIYIQCGSLTDAPSITLLSAKLVDNTGAAPDLVVWEGEKVIDWWANAVTLAPSKLNELAPGDDLAVTYSVTGENGSIKILEVTEGWAENKVLPSFAALPGYQAEYETVYLGAKGDAGVFTLPMDAESVELVTNKKNVQMMICGDGLTVTKVEIVKSTTSVSGIISDVDAAPEYYNLHGVRVVNPAAGVYIVKQGGKTTKRIIR